MTVSVRDARPGDAEPVFVLAGVLARSFVPERDAFGVAFMAVVDRSDAHVLVAETGGRIIGYLLGADHPGARDVSGAPPLTSDVSRAPLLTFGRPGASGAPLLTPRDVSPA